MKISVIIVNYNKKELLEKCLLSLDKVKYPNFQTIVIDNGSNDGSQELIKKYFANVKIIEVGYNSGFCKGNNIGIRASLASGADAIILLNNDTEVESDFLTEMVKAINVENKIGMVAAKILFLERKEIIDSMGLEITPDGLAKNRGLEKNAVGFNERKEVFCPAGAAALYTKELLKDIEFEGQYLDEMYGYYYEELDFGWRARLRGWKCAFAPNAIVYHLKSASAGAYSEFVAFYTNRNIFYNIIKNYPGIFFVKALALSFLRFPILLAGILFKKGPGAKIKNKIGIFKTGKVIIKGFIDIVINRKKMFAKRKYIQNRIAVSQEEIKRWFNDLGLPFIDSVYK